MLQPNINLPLVPLAVASHPLSDKQLVLQRLISVRGCVLQHGGQEFRPAVSIGNSVLRGDWKIVPSVGSTAAQQYRRCTKVGSLARKPVTPRWHTQFHVSRRTRERLAHLRVGHSLNGTKVDAWQQRRKFHDLRIALRSVVENNIRIHSLLTNDRTTQVISHGQSVSPQDCLAEPLRIHRLSKETSRSFDESAVIQQTHGFNLKGSWALARRIRRNGACVCLLDEASTGRICVMHSVDGLRTLVDCWKFVARTAIDPWLESAALRTPTKYLFRGSGPL